MACTTRFPYKWVQSGTETYGWLEFITYDRVTRQQRKVVAYNIIQGGRIL
jgi:hypothetical protein